MHIRPSELPDQPEILRIINEAALRYRDVIPADRWHEPYMSAEHLASELASGVEFSVAEENGELLGVMGMQDRGTVTLVRHAYVASARQRRGVGGALLTHVRTLMDKPILIGTWAAAEWAIAFYIRHGFALVPREETARLLRTYWSIPERQIETSVVLADARWHQSRPIVERS